MANGAVRRRAASTRGTLVRRSAIGGEIRVYQELMRLALNRRQLLQQYRMLGEKYQALEGELRATEGYRDELLAQVSLGARPLAGSRRSAPPRASEPDKEEGSPEGPVERGALELRYGGRAQEPAKE